MIFPYWPYAVEPHPAEAHATVIYRPTIPVWLIGTASKALFYGLLDTGADDTVVAGSMADLVGIAVDSEHISAILSASGPMPVAYGTVQLEVRQGKERYRWRARVGVADQPWQEPLLGHHGFLQYFDATFFGGKRQVRLKRNKVAFAK